MPYIHVAPDATYGLQQVNSRFELAAGIESSPMFPAILEAEARRTARQTVDANKLRGWHWRSDLPVEVDKSQLQIALDGSSPRALDNGLTSYSDNLVAYVVKMWFECRQVITEDITYDTDSEARADGFVKDLNEFEEID